MAVKKEKINYFELYFEWWIQDLQKKGLVRNYSKEPESLLMQDPVLIYSNVHYKTKPKVIASHNLCPLSSYTRDFDVEFHRSLLDVFIGYLVPIEKNSYELKEIHDRTIGDAYFQFSYYYILNIKEVKEDWITVSFDVKPPSSALEFSPSFSSSKTFPYNQKLMVEKYGIYVNKVIPTGSKDCLFNKTFVPQRYLFTDGGTRERTLNSKFFKGEIKSVDQWLQSINVKPIK